MSIEATGRQPFVVWKCENCARIDLEQWVGGTHRDPYHETRCSGQPIETPFYLVSQDEYLDVLLQTAQKAAEARIEALTAALREIAAMSSQVSPYEPRSRQHASDVARKALATSEQAEEEGAA